MVGRLGFRRRTARYCWRTLVRVLRVRPSALETAFILMALYVHLGKQVDFLIPAVEARIRRLRGEPGEGERCADVNTLASVPS